MMWIRPPKLRAGDTVATVSLSWGGAGDPDILWRYQQGKKRLEDVFGLKVVEMPHTLSGSEFVYQHPEKRAQDLMDAFRDPEIKGIFSCIGGYESVRMLPWINYNTIRQNPKVFMGYSDSTITHLICRKAGLVSFYGPSVLAEFAENVAMHPETIEGVKRAVFSAEPAELPQLPQWTSEHLPWVEENKDRQRQLFPRGEARLLQGSGTVRGRLTGGCMEVLEMAKGTRLWPQPEEWNETLLFLETSEDTPEPTYVEYWLRNYASQGILHCVSGILFGKPYGDKHHEAYLNAFRKVLAEAGLERLPVLTNLSFGHTAPMMTLPAGAMAELNCDTRTLRLLESGVTE